MTFVNWLKMFGMTLAIGTAVSVIIGLLVQIADPNLTVFNYSILVFVNSGLLFGTLAQLGFFAYMTLNYIALDMFRKPKIWIYVQWFLIALGFLYLVFLRAMWFDELNRWYEYLPLPVLLIAASWAGAQWKVKLTNPAAFTPTLFFLFVVTALEAIPALREDNLLAVAHMLIPLYACNAWQILVLHKYVKPRKADGAGDPSARGAGKPGANLSQAALAASGGGVGGGEADAAAQAAESSAAKKNAAAKGGANGAKSGSPGNKRR